MGKVYYPVGSLTYIKDHLRRNNLAFGSINELISFQDNYANAREQILAYQKMLLTEERNILAEGISKLENEIANDKLVAQQQFTLEADQLRQQSEARGTAEKTVLQEFTYSFKVVFKLIRIYYIHWFSEIIVSRHIKPKKNQLIQKRERHQYLVSDFEAALSKLCGAALHELNHRKKIIDEINLFIYGAIGEQKVVAELERLRDDYILINDFTHTFTKPLFYKPQRGYIKSIQIDHLLVTQAGIFLIETKKLEQEFSAESQPTLTGRPDQAHKLCPIYLVKKQLQLQAKTSSLGGSKNFHSQPYNADKSQTERGI